MNSYPREVRTFIETSPAAGGKFRSTVYRVIATDDKLMRSDSNPVVLAEFLADTAEEAEALATASL